MLNIKQNISLAPYTTFGVGGKAKFFVEVGNVGELAEAIKFAEDNKLAVFVLGGGSNVLISDDGFDGLVINPVRSKTSTEGGSSADHALQAGRTSNGIKHIITKKGIVLTAWAGEMWDDVVAYAVELNVCGIENLALIPGAVGGAVYQNIGAYGVELKNVLTSVEVYSIKTGNVVELSNEECGFDYRSSVFKKNKDLIILEAELLLSKDNKPNLLYSDLQKQFTGANPTVSEVRQAVIEMRRNKLPYPEEAGNAGSFFKNPITDKAAFDKLLQEHPDLKGRDAGEGLVKLSAAQLIEKANFKGKRAGNVGVSEKHALVLVNYGKGTAKELTDLAGRVKEAVEAKFNVKLEEEVEKIAF